MPPIEANSTVLVTGVEGFIGSALVRALMRERAAAVVNADKLTDAGGSGVASVDRRRSALPFERVDIVDRPDGPIDGPDDFIQTNIVGTFRLLEEARRHWEGLGDAARDAFRFGMYRRTKSSAR